MQTSVRFFAKRTGICLVSVEKVGSQRSKFVSDMTQDMNLHPNVHADILNLI